MIADKPFKTIDELVSLLIDERKLKCDDRKGLADFLKHTNYYRFTGYARQYQIDPKNGDNNFCQNAGYDEIRRMIEMDSRLRSLLFQQLSAIEIGIRSALAHELGREHGDGAFYLDRSSYYDLGSRPDAIIEKIASDLARSKSTAVAHYSDHSIEDDGSLATRTRKYRNVPIWVAVEVISFGRISNMIEYLSNSEPVKRAANSFSLQWDPFGSVVHSFSVLRNLCCHHRQLWHRRLDIQCPVQKKLKPRGVKFDKASPYAAILMANHYRRKIDGDAMVEKAISELLDSNPFFSEGIRIPEPK